MAGEYPRCLYHHASRTTNVAQDAEEERRLARSGWQRAPLPPEPKPAPDQTQARLAALEEKVKLIDTMLFLALEELREAIAQRPIQSLSGVANSQPDPPRDAASVVALEHGAPFYVSPRKHDQSKRR
jgi:hypothetical protein